jgi:RNA-directed DNA polymerase
MRKHVSRLRNWGTGFAAKLRCVRLKQRKRAKPIADFLCGLGVPEHSPWMTALSGKGWWQLAGTPAAHQAMTLA